MTEAPVVEEEEIDEEFENEQPRTVASQLKRPLVWGSILGIFGAYLRVRFRLYQQLR